MNGSDGDNRNDNGDVKVVDCDFTDDSDGGVKDVEGTSVWAPIYWRTVV